eukprot:TRINITY_DN10390_c0_g1_i1.p2 TRINITY_DN10390_c0_g1~~TRINITY_DN10390_c0_g1_i1.p2  ORF type:complete len:120 (-),score=22.75 TRINITY_DN10390_c0_g1_i1:9-368(-)
MVFLRSRSVGGGVGAGTASSDSLTRVNPRYDPLLLEGGFPVTVFLLLGGVKESSLITDVLSAVTVLNSLRGGGGGFMRDFDWWRVSDPTEVTVPPQGSISNPMSFISFITSRSLTVSVW